MKKLVCLIVVMLVSYAAFAQIGAVKPKEKTWKITSYSDHVGLYEDWKSGESVFSLNVKSDDSHDKVKITLSLGNREEAIESVKNLLALYDMQGEVDIFGKTFVCGKKELLLKKAGNLKSTYGKYCIEKSALLKIQPDLEKAEAHE